MLGETFKSNAVDYSEYVMEDGLKMSYVPVKGLPDKMTWDKTTHIDLLGYKRNLTVKTNPVTKAVASELTAVYISGIQLITVFDIATNADLQLFMEPASILADPVLVESGAISYYQLSDLTYKEV